MELDLVVEAPAVVVAVAAQVVGQVFAEVLGAVVVPQDPGAVYQLLGPIFHPTVDSFTFIG